MAGLYENKVIFKDSEVEIFEIIHGQSDIAVISFKFLKSDIQTATMHVVHETIKNLALERAKSTIYLDLCKFMFPKPEIMKTQAQFIRYMEENHPGKILRVGLVHSVGSSILNLLKKWCNFKTESKAFKKKSDAFEYCLLKRN